MPIKAENKARYAHNWAEIRAAILVRANNCCEFCKAPNRSSIFRGLGSDLGTYRVPSDEVFDDKNGTYLKTCLAKDYQIAKEVHVVLTIAHLDHTHENNDPANLKALCQKSHLTYDAQHHKVNAQATRTAKKLSNTTTN